MICSICREVVVLHDKIVKTTCNHQFCKECIQNWMKIKKTCPICRTKLKYLYTLHYLQIKSYLCILDYLCKTLKHNTIKLDKIVCNILQIPKIKRVTLSELQLYLFQHCNSIDFYKLFKLSNVIYILE